MFEAASHRFRASLIGSMILRALNYAPDFSGRATRTELAVICGISIGCALALGFATMFLSVLAPLNAMYLSLLAGLPIAGAIVRRLHDTGRRSSAFFILFMPYIGIFIIGGIMLFDGFAGENIFGPNPRDRRMAAR